MKETKVQCNRCKNYFRATDSHINLICKGCQNKEKRERNKLISGFQSILRNFHDHTFDSLEPIERLNWIRFEIEKALENYEVIMKK